MANGNADFAGLAGRTVSARSDSRRSRERLIDAVQVWMGDHSAPPERLVDVAAAAGVSAATAYRHFASVDDLIQAFVLQLPVRAAELFAESGGQSADPLDSLTRWNESWVAACLEHGELAVRLRSPLGFLQRRNDGDPVIAFACSLIEPLLQLLDGDVTMMLFTWNITSDPREVLDLQRLGWSAKKIANYVTRAVLATPSAD